METYTLLLLLLSFFGVAELDVNLQNYVPDCFSNNDTATYSCTLTDSFPISGTVWNGTVFNCPHSNPVIDNRIYLPHSEFDGVASGTCNNGAIVAESTGRNGSQFTSVLTIAPVTLDMNWSTVICSLLGESVVTANILRVGAVPEPPPSTIVSFPIPSQEFTVSWTKPHTVLGGVGGFLTNTSGDCGQCSYLGMVGPNTTEVSCSGWEPNGHTCNITVHTVTADCQFQSVKPALTTVHLKLPVVPNIESTLGVYNLSGSLQRFKISLPRDNPRIDENGFSITYFLIYTHSSNKQQEVVVSCTNSINCTIMHKAELTYGVYSIEIGAQTSVGKNIDHNVTTIDTTNNFVDVTVHVHERYTIINCLFFSEHKHISCRIEYGPDCIHLSSSKGAAAINESDITLLLFNTTTNCFVLTATNGTYTVEVQGEFKGYSQSLTLSSTLIAILVLAAFVFILSLVSMAAVSGCVVVCHKKAHKDRKQPLYYSTVSGPPGDPTYEDIEAVGVFNTNSNDAYHLNPTSASKTFAKRNNINSPASPHP